MSRDRAIVVCMRCEEQRLPIDDSIVKTCALCSRDVWVTPASLKAVESYGIAYDCRCFECVPEKHKRGRSTVPATPEQAAELTAHRRKYGHRN